MKSSFPPFVAAAAALVATLPVPVLAAEAAPAAGETAWLLGPFGFWWLLGVAGASLALWQAWQFYGWMERQDPGTQRMIDIAGYVRTGADAYLKQQ
ncbi:MAG: hypothetical protein ACKOES_12510 [Planctomycetaceae bacterium]